MFQPPTGSKFLLRMPQDRLPPAAWGGDYTCLENECFKNDCRGFRHQEAPFSARISWILFKLNAPVIGGWNLRLRIQPISWILFEPDASISYPIRGCLHKAVKQCLLSLHIMMAFSCRWPPNCRMPWVIFWQGNLQLPKLSKEWEYHLPVFINKIHIVISLTRLFHRL